MPIPTDIHLHQQSRILEITFDTGERFELSCEFLRVFSPSAEVRGHGIGQEVLQEGKINVNISQIVPVGTYAVTLHFDDGHNTGIYSWEWLYNIARNQDKLWQEYLERLAKESKSREPS